MVCHINTRWPSLMFEVVSFDPIKFFMKHTTQDGCSYIWLQLILPAGNFQWFCWRKSVQNRKNVQYSLIYQKLHSAQKSKLKKISKLTKKNQNSFEWNNQENKLWRQTVTLTEETFEAKSRTATWKNWSCMAIRKSFALSNPPESRQWIENLNE